MGDGAERWSSLAENESEEGGQRSMSRSLTECGCFTLVAGMTCSGSGQRRVVGVDDWES